MIKQSETKFTLFHSLDMQTKTNQIMSGNKNKRAAFMGVRYSDQEITKLKEKATSKGMAVSTFVRHASLQTLNK